MSFQGPFVQKLVYDIGFHCSNAGGYVELGKMEKECFCLQQLHSNMGLPLEHKSVL